MPRFTQPQDGPISFNLSEAFILQAHGGGVVVLTVQMACWTELDWKLQRLDELNLPKVVTVLLYLLFPGHNEGLLCSQGYDGGFSAS